MGWTCHPDTTKEQLVNELSSNVWWGENFNVIKHSIRGGNLFMCVENILKSKAFIMIFRIEVQGNELCYKDMCDSMGPCYYDCPIKFIDWADNHVHGTPEGFGQEWRQKVRDTAKAKSTKNRVAYNESMVIEFDNKQYKLKEKLGPRQGWTVEDLQDGIFYRMPMKHLNNSKIINGELADNLN